MGTPDTPSERWTLYNLPLAAKLAIATFLISAGLGYFSALVNLHFQEATPGKALPDENDVVRAYSSKDKASQFERLIIAHPSLPFNGEGSMRRVFTEKSVRATDKKLKAVAKRMNRKDHTDPRVKELFYKELEGERVVLVAWLQQEDKKGIYEKDAFQLEGKLKTLDVTPEFVEEDDSKVRLAKVKSIIEARCVRCHSESAGGAPGRFPLGEWEEIEVYTKTEQKGKSLSHLAMSTHVHLLGFSMLYGLTGLLLALTPLPGWIRVPLAPAALLAQVIDIAFWWMARLDEPHGPMFAKGIIVTGGIVAVSLGAQILLTLFTMFGKGGKVVLIFLIVISAGGGFGLTQRFILPYLAKEGGAMTSSESEAKDKDRKKDDQKKQDALNKDQGQDGDAKKDNDKDEKKDADGQKDKADAKDKEKADKNDEAKKNDDAKDKADKKENDKADDAKKEKGKDDKKGD
jgi:hypothetical protein